MLLTFAGIAWAYQQQEAWDEASPLRTADQAFLRDVSKRVQKHRLRSPKGGARLTDDTLRLGYLRRDFEQILDAALGQEDSYERDQRIASRLKMALEDRGLAVTSKILGAVLVPLIREGNRTEGQRRDWVRGLNGPRDTAGRILDKLGVKLGWLGSSAGNTNRLRQIVDDSESEFAARTADQLQISAFMLASLGVPSRSLPWVSFLVYLAARGESLSLRLGQAPPALPKRKDDLKRARPSPLHDMPKSEVDESFAATWGDFEAMRREVQARFPKADLPSNSEWISIWKHLTFAALPLARLFDLPADEEELLALDEVKRCVFHGIPIADSTASRSGIPREVDHPFHGKPIGHSTQADHPLKG